MKTISEIEAICREFSDARRVLEQAVADLDEQLSKVKRDNMPMIRMLSASAAQWKTELRLAVEESADLFKRPKTRIFSGIKVGYAKGKGKIEFADATAVVKLIRRHLPDRFDELVKTTESPIRGALNRLPASDLKRIGVTVIDASDEVVVAPTDSEIDKLVDALLKDEEESKT